MDVANQLILLVGLLFVGSILATVPTPRLGVPLLLVFLCVGMLAGEDGLLRIDFDNYVLANLSGTAALAVILFDGGLRTELKTFRVGLRPAVALASVGVVVTTLIIGCCAAWLLGLQLAEGLLIGAIVGSTDAAAVFSLLQGRSGQLNERVRSALEIESGSNDPMAVFLTLALLGYLQAPDDYRLLASLGLLVQQLGLGAVLGIGGGRLLVWALNRFTLTQSLYPLMALFGGLTVFGLTASLGGSGFLAVYLCGIIVGSRRVTAISSIKRFHDGVAWMAQIGMFVILGLLATPSRLLPLLVPGLLLATVLILIARPVAVWLSLLPFRFPWREQAYVSWVGLRGSVPIVLATYPLMVGLEHAWLFFDIAFFIVIVSLLVQGSTVVAMARWLGLQLPVAADAVIRQDFDLPGTLGYEIVSYRLGADSRQAGRDASLLALPADAQLVCVIRDRQLLSGRHAPLLQVGDYVTLLAHHDHLDELDQKFQSARQPEAEALAAALGELGAAPELLLSTLADSYRIELPAELRASSLAEYFAEQRPRPVVGDRLRLGRLQLFVRQMQGNRVTEFGISLDAESSRVEDGPPRSN